MNRTSCLRRLVVQLGLLLGSAGCTVSQYEISQAELTRLAQLHPAERGRRVQALQQTTYDRDALGLEEQATHDASNASLVLLGNSTQVERERRKKRTEEKDDDGSSAGQLAAIAFLALAVTGVVLVPLAVTEGTRYDGWVDFPEDQALYLVGEGRWISLAELSPEDVRGVARAVAPDWGAHVERLERRPLDRIGFAYQLAFAGARLPLPEDAHRLGYGGRLALGGHPTQTLGLFAGGQFAYGASADDGSFLGKLFASVQFLPAAFGAFHAGVFADAGFSHLVHSRTTNVATSGAFFAGGPVFELALSTHLALTLRASVASVPTESGRQWVPEGSFGVAVY